MQVFCCCVIFSVFTFLVQCIFLPGHQSLNRLVLSPYTVDNICTADDSIDELALTIRSLPTTKRSLSTSLRRKFYLASFSLALPIVSDSSCRQIKPKNVKLKTKHFESVSF